MIIKMQVHLITTPTEIHQDVLNWLTAGWNEKPETSLPFLKHLYALKKAADLPGEGFIVLESGSTLHPNFNEMIGPIISKIPPEYDVCLLSHFVSSWDGVNFIGGTDNKLVTVTKNVHGSFAYWIRSSHVEHLLAIYDQPLRNIFHVDLTPEKISRFGRVCMAHIPIVANLTEKYYQTYFSNYDFKSC